MDSFIALVCNFRSQNPTMLISCVKHISGFSLPLEYNLNIFPQTQTCSMKWLLLPLSFIFCYVSSHLLFLWFWNIPSCFLPQGLFAWARTLFSLPFTFWCILEISAYHRPRKAFLDHPLWAGLPYHHTVTLCHCTNGFLHYT